MRGHRNPRNPDTESLVSAANPGKEESLPPRGPGPPAPGAGSEKHNRTPQEALHLIVSLRRGPRGRRVLLRAPPTPPTGQARSHSPRPRPHPRARPPAPRPDGGAGAGNGGGERRLRFPALRPASSSAGPEGEAEHSPRQRLGPPAGTAPDRPRCSRCRLLLLRRRSFLETPRAPAAPRRALRD